MRLNEKTILLRVLEFEPEELTVLLKMAVSLLYSDGIAETEEWNLLTLVPALCEVAKEDTPEDLREKWEKKIAMVKGTIEEGQAVISQDEMDTLRAIKEPEKRDACLLMLFMIASCDRSVNKKELDMIISEIARPWNYSIDRLMSLIKGAGEEIKRPGELVMILESYNA
jgi:hypothetical protein